VSKITGLKMGKSREKRVNVFLDGGFSFSLLAEVALKQGLKKGQEISESEIEELKGTDHYQRCYNAAVRYLAYRPRSESEVRQRLHRHGFDTECTEKTIGRLKEQGLIDDTEFARFWIENRETFSPRSRRLAVLELQRKGLDKNTIEKIADKVNDNESAYRAAVKKANRLAATDFATFRRRLGAHLTRRGFGYEVVKETIERTWKELGENAGNLRV
jgi:regulatory protein